MVSADTKAKKMNQKENAVARVLDTTAPDLPTIPIIARGGKARVVLWPGNGAVYRTMHVIDLEPTGRTTDLTHRSDAVYYVVSGHGSVLDLKAKTLSDLIEGAVIHIDARDAYRFEADKGEALRLLGGPCPADEGLYAGLVPEV
jgi:mannose-6-phosphate isomerase-like protein (cupin superfamily)